MVVLQVEGVVLRADHTAADTAADTSVVLPSISSCSASVDTQNLDFLLSVSYTSIRHLK